MLRMLLLIAITSVFEAAVVASSGFGDWLKPPPKGFLLQRVARADREAARALDIRRHQIIRMRVVERTGGTVCRQCPGTDRTRADRVRVRTACCVVLELSARRIVLMLERRPDHLGMAVRAADDVNAQ